MNTLLKLFSQIDIDPEDLDLPMPVVDDPSTTRVESIATIMEVVFAVLGAVAFLVIVIAGLQFVLSRGDPEKAGRARNTIIYALVGLVIAMLAFGLVRLVTELAG